jgi:acyl-coenzyme A synthetase/AMP-(fatty) acid ligase
MCSAGDLAHQMSDANARLVFTIPAFLDTVHEAAKLARCDEVILLGEAAGTLRFAALVACQAGEPAVPIDPHSLAGLPYSSATTGLSKGVVLTHLKQLIYSRRKPI